MLDATLKFNPNRRISAAEALTLPYLQELHDPRDEPDCPSTVVRDFVPTRATFNEEWAPGTANSCLRAGLR